MAFDYLESKLFIVGYTCLCNHVNVRMVVVLETYTPTLLPLLIPFPSIFASFIFYLLLFPVVTLFFLKMSRFAMSIFILLLLVNS